MSSVVFPSLTSFPMVWVRNKWTRTWRTFQASAAFLCRKLNSNWCLCSRVEWTNFAFYSCGKLSSCSFKDNLTLMALKPSFKCFSGEMYSWVSNRIEINQTQINKLAILKEFTLTTIFGVPAYVYPTIMQRRPGWGGWQVFVIYNTLNHFALSS